MLSRINEYMPHTSTVYLALLLINPAVKQGEASPSPPSPSCLSPTASKITCLKARHSTDSPKRSILHHAVYSMCCVMSLPHLCVVYMLLCGSLRDSSMWFLHPRPFENATSEEYKINMCIVCANNAPFFCSLAEYIHSSWTLKVFSGKKGPLSGNSNQLHVT